MDVLWKNRSGKPWLHQWDFHYHHITCCFQRLNYHIVPTLKIKWVLKWIYFLLKRSKQLYVCRAKSSSISKKLFKTWCLWLYYYQNLHQVTRLCTKAAQKLGLLRRSCYFVNDNRRARSLYLTLVRSLFESCAVVWRPTTAKLISKLESIQKRQRFIIVNAKS